MVRHVQKLSKTSAVKLYCEQASIPDATLLSCAHYRVLDRAKIEDINDIVYKIPFGTCAHVLGIPQPSAVFQVLSHSQVLMHNVILQYVQCRLVVVVP